MKKILIALTLLVTTLAAQADCPELYPGGVAIPTKPGVVELCNSFYVAQYDQRSNRTIFTSHRLQANTLIGSPTRLSSFRSDPRVRNSPRNSEYTGTGFDRGHLVPAEDAATPEQMYDTFFLTNVIPQDATLNRGEWKRVEAVIRLAAVRLDAGEMYVVTVPVYDGLVHLMSNRLPIPTGIWKFAVTNKVTQAYFADNTATGRVVSYGHHDWRAVIRTQYDRLH